MVGAVQPAPACRAGLQSRPALVHDNASVLLWAWRDKEMLLDPSHSLLPRHWPLESASLMRRRSTGPCIRGPIAMGTTRATHRARQKLEYMAVPT